MIDTDVARFRTKKKDSIRFRDSLPESFIENNERLISLLEAYFEYLNSSDISPMYILDQQVVRDIDSIEDRYFPLLEDELSPLLPSRLVPDKERLFKLLPHIYNSKGTIESIESFFKILFNVKSEVYYPKDDLFACDDGEWDSEFRVQIAGSNPPEYIEGDYRTNGGMLDDLKYLRDDIYYQEYSYEVRVGLSPEDWKDFFDNLIHPSGFISFGRVLILLEFFNSKLKMPKFQPGFVIPEEVFKIFSEQFSMNQQLISDILNIFFSEKFKFQNNKIRYKNGHRHIDTTTMNVYAQYSTEELQNLEYRSFLIEQKISQFSTVFSGNIQFMSGEDILTMDNSELTFLS